MNDIVQKWKLSEQRDGKSHYDAFTMQKITGAALQFSGIYQSNMADRSVLPVTEYKRSIIRAVETNNQLVIVGETGSGKTTQIPQFLHEAGLGKHGKIAVTQPRRLGAISVARRVSEEMKCNLGGKESLTVRMDAGGVY